MARKGVAQKLTPRDRYLRSTYGITEVQFDSMLRAQSNGCAVCSGVNGGHTLNVDHDHRSKRVRGLLCRRCNKYLVGRHKNGALLRAAADYLDRKVALGL